MKDFGICVFGHTRAFMLGDLLESLKRQSAIEYVDLWVDGYQGKTDLKNKVHITRKVGNSYQVATRRYHNGQLGFRKLMLQALQSAAHNYRHILFLEDDCFPTRNAVRVFREELEEIQSQPEVFSVYGHPFLMAEESGYCNRFQGWGWATTSEKLTPYIDRMIECYSMSEQDYLDFTRETLTNDVKTWLDVTPPRLPSYTLETFFAWDETLALLVALDKRVHKVAKERIIYNCGMGEGSAHFSDAEQFLKPPFNLIPPDQVWDVF